MKTTPELVTNIQAALADYVKAGSDPLARRSAMDAAESIMFINVDAILADLIDFHGIAAKFAPWDGVTERRAVCALQAAVDRFSPRDIR